MNRLSASKDVQIRHWWLYILRLEDGKFYVGITSKTPEIRMQEHQNGKQSAYWTAKHRPIEIIYREDLGHIKKDKAERYENKMTRSIMKKQGVNNVRGGDLTHTNDYVVRFGYIFDKENWEDMFYITLMFIILAVFIVDKYIYPILPGGVR